MLISRRGENKFRDWNGILLDLFEMRKGNVLGMCQT